MKRSRFSLFILLIVTVFVSCNKNGHNEYLITQPSRDKVEYVDPEKISFWTPDSTILSELIHLIPSDSLLLIRDSYSYDDLVAVYTLKDYKYIGAFGQIGQGPYEVTRPGPIARGLTRGKLYVNDYGKLQTYRYDIDSALTDKEYVPEVWKKYSNKNLISREYFINDTSAIVRKFSAKSDNFGVYVMGRYNPETESFTQYSPQDRVGQYLYDVSIDDNLIVEAGGRRDVIYIYDLDGNPLHEIHGPMYEEEKSTGLLAFTQPLIVKDRFYIPWVGKDTREGGDLYPTDVLVFSLDGTYLKTLRFPYHISEMSFNPVRNTLLIHSRDFDEIAEIKIPK